MRAGIGAAIAASIALTAAPARADTAVGLTYKPIGIEFAGLEVEAGPVWRGWMVGGLVQARRLATASPPTPWQVPEVVTAWGRMANADLPHLEVGWLLGVSVRLADPNAGLDPGAPWGAAGPVLGASATLRSGDLWLRLSPNYALGLDPPSPLPLWLPASGIPLAEAGWRLTPQLEVSARLGSTFARVAWLFD